MRRAKPVRMILDDDLIMLKSNIQGDRAGTNESGAVSQFHPGGSRWLG